MKHQLTAVCNLIVSKCRSIIYLESMVLQSDTNMMIGFPKIYEVMIWLNAIQISMCVCLSWYIEADIHTHMYTSWNQSSFK